uniref:antitermination protein n=1 Tax=Salmonella enterica TaxID=28901 RepID=UPI0020CD09D6
KTLLQWLNDKNKNKGTNTVDYKDITCWYYGGVWLHYAINNNARCRCGGKGEVLDRIATKERGVPVFKTCERCSGEGYSRVSSA